MWLSAEIVKPVRPLPETEGIQGALAFLYNGTPNEIEPSVKIVEELCKNGKNASGATEPRTLSQS